MNKFNPDDGQARGTNPSQAGHSLTIRQMTSDEFAEWQRHAIDDYAHDVAAARGIDASAAREIANQAHERFLPNGLASAGVHLVVGLDADDAKVGILWLGPNPDGVGPAWVFDIEVVESRRGEGWGRALMNEAERLARADGHNEIGLNVFG